MPLSAWSLSRWLVRTSVAVAAPLLLLAISGCSSGGFEKAAAEQVAAANPLDAGTATFSKLGGKQPEDTEPYYADALDQWLRQGAADASATVGIDASRPSAVSSAEAVSAGVSYDGRDGVLVWKPDGDSWVEYRFVVPASGLYEIDASYHPIAGESHTRPILWDVSLDGAHPFRESSSIALYREWTDERPVRLNDEGEEIRPRSIDISAWSTKPLVDASAGYALPFKWYLTKGEHVIRLQGSEPVALQSLSLQPPEQVQSYAEVAAAYPEDEAEASAGGVQTLEAEAFTSKNDPSVQMSYDTDQRTVPVTKGKIRFNTLGGIGWDQPNQQATWTFDVPEDGLYQIALRTLQNSYSQKASYRQIRIDGSVPFAEFLDYRFPYSGSWRRTVLADDSGKPYLLYLTAGSHTLSLAVNDAKTGPIVRGIGDLTELLRSAQDDLLALTGGQTDNNRTWRIRQDLPDLPDRLRQAAQRLDTLSAMMKEANGRKDSISQGLGSAAGDLRTLLRKEDDIPKHVDEISSIIEQVNTYTLNLAKHPLQIDEIAVAPAGQSFPKMTASPLQKAKGTLVNFYYSFDRTDSIGKQDDRVLNVWVQRGRDYVTELQALADETFTPDTGIKVKVNLLPNSELLVLSNAAGLQPDVALGLSQDLPVDYAIRGSLYDLSQFPDFQQMYDKFSPGSWLPVYYNKGYYALPETQSFQVLYYRKDILNQLGLGIPQTWEDVYDMLPTLQEHYKNFYYNWQEFIPFFSQHGVEFYTPDGLQTAVDSPQGFAAFKQWTDLFNTYALDKEVPSFYEHFRDGTMPIGISDYNMYIQLAAAAPELNGRWGIALIPGVKQTDGTISRWAGGVQTTGVIFQSSKKKEQAWSFLKWWMSTDTQVRYGSDLESMNGVSFRWNTANIDAFMQLPWKKEDAKIILQTWAWYKEKPNIPGGYFFGREIRNAWVRTAVDGIQYRTSMEQAVLDIDRELRRKQEEFGFVDEEGRPLKQMEIPVVNEPWKGVDRYVR